MILQTILEGFGLGGLLVLVCAVGHPQGHGGHAVISAVLAGIMTVFVH